MSSSSSSLKNSNSKSAAAYDEPPKEERNLFFQKSKSTQEEFALLNFTVKREIAIEKLAKNIHDVNNKVCENTNDVILESFTLFNNVRMATFELIEAVNNWQQAFTKAFRPQLKESDYLIKMIRKIEFVSSTCLRRLYNFQFKEGNIFLLPLFNPRKIEPHEVDSNLGKQCINFAFPSEERLIKCYKILLNCLPHAAFHKILPIEEWLSKRWRPPIVILNHPTPQTAVEEKQGHHDIDNDNSIINNHHRHKQSASQSKDNHPQSRDSNSPISRNNSTSLFNKNGHILSSYNEVEKSEEQLLKEKLERKKKEILAEPNEMDADFKRFKELCQKFSENILTLSSKTDEKIFVECLESGDKKKKLRDVNIITEFKLERDKGIDSNTLSSVQHGSRTGTGVSTKLEKKEKLTVEEKAKMMSISTLKMKQDWKNATLDLADESNSK